MGQILSSSAVQATSIVWRLLSSCSMGLQTSCSGGPLLICGGSAPLYLSRGAGGESSSLVVVVGLLSSCGRVHSSNCDGGGYYLVVM